MKILLVNKHSASRAGFTLAEVMVSSVLIVMIMGLLLQTVSQTQKVWAGTTAKVAQFQGARVGFESMVRRLSMATLNTYWRAYDGDLTTQREDYTFIRKSELQFLSGPSAKIFDKLRDIEGDVEKVFPTQSVFFFAPTGNTEESLQSDEVKDNPNPDGRRFRMADSLMSACGYFVEFGDEDKPDFIQELDFPKKYRYRLKEMSVPSEMVTIFRQPTTEDVGTKSPGAELKDKAKNITQQFIMNEKENIDTAMANEYKGLVDVRRNVVGDFIRPQWMKTALFRERAGESEDKVARFRFARSLADNVIALIILPKTVDVEREGNKRKIGSLAPKYAFDSWRELPGRNGGAPAKYFAPRDCLMPPILQVTLVAIDEQSALRAAFEPTTLPAWTEGLFEQVNLEQDYLNDIEELEKRLQADPSHPVYRIFTTDVVIRSSKWSGFLGQN
jgi:uncharacterized protein (TIGR02599 family)